jgi:hypothetical protein
VLESVDMELNLYHFLKVERQRRQEFKVRALK